MALTNSQRQAQFKRRKKEVGGLNLNIFVDAETAVELDNIANRYQVTKQSAVKMAMASQSLPTNGTGRTSQLINDNDLQVIFHRHNATF